MVLLLSALWAFCGIRRDAGVNLRSRMALIDSLVHRHTHIIDDSRYGYTMDKVRLPDGHFVSEKTPLLSLLGAKLYRQYLRTTHHSLSRNESEVIWFLGLFLGWLPLALTFFFFALTLERFPIPDVAFFLASLAFSLGYLGIGYATTITGHVAAGTTLMMAFYFAVVLRRSSLAAFPAFLCALAVGAFATLAPAFDLPTALIGLAVILYAARTNARLWAAVLAGAIPIVFLQMFMNLQATGYWYPVYLRKEWLLYPGSYWNHPKEFDALHHSKVEFLAQMICGFRGFFSTTPVLIFSLAEMLAASRPMPWHAEKRCFLAALFLMLTFFTFFATNLYGGYCLGLRYFIALQPFFFLALGFYFARARSPLLYALFGLSLAASFAHVLLAWQDPWQSSYLERLMVHWNWLYVELK